MSVDELQHRIRSFIRTSFPLAARQDLPDNQSLLDSGIVDSLGVLDIVEFLESELGVVPTDEEVVAENFESIDAIVSFARGKLQLTGEQPQ